MLNLSPAICVIARAGQTSPGRLAIADIVADHRLSPVDAAARAASVLDVLPGCEMFLVADSHGGYLAFTRGGACFSIRRPGNPRAAEDADAIPAAAAECCAAALYGRVCSGQIPPAV